MIMYYHLPGFAANLYFVVLLWHFTRVFCYRKN